MTFTVADYVLTRLSEQGVDTLWPAAVSVRRGAHGAFILDHGRGGSLWVHINGDAAFLWF